MIKKSPPRARAYSENTELFTERIYSALRLRKIRKLIPRSATLLDLGCGFHGHALRNIEDIISAGTGVDVFVAAPAVGEKIRLVEHDINRGLPFDDESFDVVISLAVLEHLDDPGRTLSEILRVLRPQGVLLLTTPTVFSRPILEFLSYRLKIVSELEIRDHKRYFDRRSLLNYCEQAGFSSCVHRYFQLYMNNFLVAGR